MGDGAGNVPPDVWSRAAVAAGAVGFARPDYIVYLTLPDVRVLATTNPSSTAFMGQPGRRSGAGGAHHAACAGMGAVLRACPGP